MALLNWLPSQLPSCCDCCHGELFEREFLHGKVHNVKSSAPTLGRLQALSSSGRGRPYVRDCVATEATAESERISIREVYEEMREWILTGGNVVNCASL
jgi:hypothetical protein